MTAKNHLLTSRASLPFQHLQRWSCSSSCPFQTLVSHFTMSIRVLLRSHPHRAIAFVTSSHALIIRHSSSSIEPVTILSSVSAQGSSGNGAARCMVDFSPLNAVDLSDYRPLTPLPIEGTLGLITVDNDVFLCAVNGSTRVATVRPGETVQKVESVEFC